MVTIHFFHLEFLFKKKLVFYICVYIQTYAHICLTFCIARFIDCDIYLIYYVINVQVFFFSRKCVFCLSTIWFCAVFFLQFLLFVFFKNTARLIFIELSWSFYCHRIGFYFAIITSNLIKQKITFDVYFLR